MIKKYLVVVECALEHNGKFLIIKRPTGKHAAGLLSFPGGAVEESDDSMDILRSAVKREIFEEVGLVLKDPINYVTTTFFVDDFGTPIVDSIFHVKLNETELCIKASEREVPEYYWMSREEIDKAENAPEWLKRYVNSIKR